MVPLEVSRLRSTADWKAKTWHAAAMDKKYWSGAHTKHRLRFHIVWLPKYRRRVLRGAVSARLQELLWQAAEVNAWQLHELAVRDDHVHVLIQINPRESVAEVVQRLKGGTSRRIREEFPELEEFLWGDSLWADGYFAESVGAAEARVIEKYIRDQKESRPEQTRIPGL
jgi:putative transposase